MLFIKPEQFSGILYKKILTLDWPMTTKVKPSVEIPIMQFSLLLWAMLQGFCYVLIEKFFKFLDPEVESSKL